MDVYQRPSLRARGGLGVVRARGFVGWCAWEAVFAGSRGFWGSASPVTCWLVCVGGHLCGLATERDGLVWCDEARCGVVRPDVARCGVVWWCGVRDRRVNTATIGPVRVVCPFLSREGQKDFVKE